MGTDMKYPDIFFTEEYQNLFKDTEFGGEPCQFTSSGIDYRFYKRHIEGTHYYDIYSPYGMSGPIAVGEFINWGHFILAFTDYCTKENIIAEFARLHPFLSGSLRYIEEFQSFFDFRINIYLSRGCGYSQELVDDLFSQIPDGFPNTLSRCCHYEHDIFYVDLAQSEEQIWKGFDKGCKSAVKKQQSKLWLLFDNGDLSEWYPYFENSPNYQFGKQWLVKLLNDPHAQLITVRNSVQTLSGAVLLTYGDYCHYFLAAGGNQNYLLWQSIKWAKSQGCKIFNLGGGLKDGDSLESFKKSFTKTSKPFYTYRKIHDQIVYDDLCKAKGIDPNSNGFFPSYRR
jgi:hypothetical protein